PESPRPGAALPAALRLSRCALRLPSGPQFLLEIDSPLLRHRQQPGNVLADGRDPRGVLQLAGGVLEAQRELLVARLLDALHQLVVLEVVRLGSLHDCSAAPSRRTNLVLIGSLCPASRIASFARSSGTPASSNMTLPGLTTATQPSGLPLPEPMRV